jgi:hypothetical protein
MSETVWKIELTDSGGVAVPANAAFLYAREQHESVCAWFRCDPAAPREVRRLFLVGTGGPVPETAGRFLGAAHLQGGSLIIHVFEEAK